jgi:serralysin
MSRRYPGLTVTIATILSIAVASSAHAAFHLWQIGEVYSNASGTVQFIELFTNASGQDFTGGSALSSNSHSFTLPTDLPSDTTNHFFLLATPGYFALSGVPKADFNLGVNNFFSTSGDTLNWANVNSLSFTGVQLPLDGVNSLNRAFNATSFTDAKNSPTNFAGQAGSIPEPATWQLAILGLSGIAAWFATTARRHSAAL